MDRVRQTFVSRDRYVEGSAGVNEPQLRVLGGYNVFVRNYAICCKGVVGLHSLAAIQTTC